MTPDDAACGARGIKQYAVKGALIPPGGGVSGVSGADFGRKTEPVQIFRDSAGAQGIDFKRRY